MKLFVAIVMAALGGLLFGALLVDIALAQAAAPKPKLPVCHTICTPTETLVTCEGWGDQALVVAQCAAPRKSFMEAYHHG